MKLSLIVAKGRRKGKIVPVAGQQFIIGRHKECHLRAGSAAVSQHHCAIITRGEKVFVHDFDSTNGTFVNRQRVRGEQELAEDDLLEIGSLAFRIHLEAEAEEPASVPPVGSEADDSMVANMLLKESEPEAAGGILGLLDDSRCGSTVLQSPVAPPEEKDDSAESPPAPENPPPLATDNEERAKEILEKFERSVREKYNRT